MTPRNLFSKMASNPKTAKAMKRYEGLVLHLAPHTLGDRKRSVCPDATAGCVAACLNTSGRAQSSETLESDAIRNHPIHAARIRRTNDWWGDRNGFVYRLNRELGLLAKRATKKGLMPIARLNGTSDIPWEQWGVPQLNESIQFYDYTKSRRRAYDSAGSDKWPDNYYLTYSKTEADAPSDVADMIEHGVNVAIVFAAIPKEWYGMPVIDGRTHDHRFLYPRGHIVGLTPLGRAKHDTSGFVVKTPQRGK